MLTSRLAVVALATASVALATPPALAEEAGAAPASAGRTLAGHTFMPSVTVAEPFVTTSLAATTIVGVGSTTGSFQVGDSSFDGTFEYAGIGGLLAYEYAFREDLSARVLLQNFIYSGINGSSAIAVGSQVKVGGGAGLTWSTQLSDATRLGVLFDVSYVPSLALTIGSGLKSIADTCKASSCTVDLEQVFGQVNATTLQPSVSASWAVSRALGATATVSYLHAIFSGRTDGTGDAMALGTALDFDFLAISSVPVGLQAAVNWTAPIGGTGLQHVTDLGAGVFYTARRDLSAGVQLVFRRFQVNPSVDVSWSTTLAEIGLRYYW